MDGHDSYPRAIDTELGSHVRHRTNRYLTNRMELDHRKIKGRYQPMLGFKSSLAAARFVEVMTNCATFSDLVQPVTNVLPPITAGYTFLSRSLTALSILQAA